MNKILVLLVAAGFLIVAAGCTSMSVKKESMKRVDIDVAGNQGVIYGPTPAPHTVENANRDVIAVDVELPTYHGTKPEAKTQAEKIK